MKAREGYGIAAVIFMVAALVGGRGYNKCSYE